MEADHHSSTMPVPCIVCTGTRQRRAFAAGTSSAREEAERFDPENPPGNHGSFFDTLPSQIQILCPGNIYCFACFKHSEVHADTRVTIQYFILPVHFVSTPVDIDDP